MLFFQIGVAAISQKWGVDYAFVLLAFGVPTLAN